ncbi:hypothetical protein IB277_06425 [Ensifer sp. ENS07]|uniref:hypothetical protein n=1 Tax=Ensifer sp. ENS07 TaxID=2769274 RepID=UPI001786C39A|nr:hypothetical protein [Ensifer sp. ENS07]MBD9635928.1 hypothetical protein [Ensifer sp. ENS07]
MTDLASIDRQQTEIERLERELEEARDVPWPDWASAILKTLKANGYDPVDDAGEVDLGEAFEDYLEGIAQAEEQQRTRMADVFAVHDGGNSITLHFGEIKSAKAFRDAFPPGIVSAPAPCQHVPCPCTLIEQDEDCPVGYPSMICGVCKGTGNTTPEQVSALACEMIKIASDMGEPEDPFAAWESISLIQSEHASFRKALDKISGMIEDENADFDEAIETATHALVAAKAESPQKPAPIFPPSCCTAWEDCDHDGICHDSQQCQAIGPNHPTTDGSDNG